MLIAVSASASAVVSVPILFAVPVIDNDSADEIRVPLSLMLDATRFVPFDFGMTLLPAPFVMPPAGVLYAPVPSRK